MTAVSVVPDDVIGPDESLTADKLINHYQYSMLGNYYICNMDCNRKEKKSTNK